MHTNMRLHCVWMRYWPYNVRFAEPIKGEHLASPLGVPREHPLPLPLGEVAERSEGGEGRHVKKTCRCRHVKKICQWHIFSVDRGGYAAVASFLVCTASSFSPDRGGYAAEASILVCTAPSWIPSQSPAVTALPTGEPGAYPLLHSMLT